MLALSEGELGWGGVDRENSLDGENPFPSGTECTSQEQKLKAIWLPHLDSYQDQASVRVEGCAAQVTSQVPYTCLGNISASKSQKHQVTVDSDVDDSTLSAAKQSAARSTPKFRTISIQVRTLISKR